MDPDHEHLIRRLKQGDLDQLNLNPAWIDDEPVIILTEHTDLDTVESYITDYLAAEGPLTRQDLMDAGWTRNEVEAVLGRLRRDGVLEKVGTEPIEGQGRPRTLYRVSES